MPKAFNLTAKLNIIGPFGIDQVVRQVKAKLADVSVKVDIKLGKSAQDIARINRDFERFNLTLKDTAVVSDLAARSLSNLSAAVNGTQFNRAATQINTVTTSIRTAGKSFKDTTKEIDTATFSAVKFGRDSALALKRFAAFTIPTTVFFGISAGFGAGVKSALDFERQLVRIAQTLKVPLSGLTGLTNTITSLSTNLGVASSELVDISLVLNQAGLSAKDTATALDVLAKTALSPSFDDLKNSTEGVIAIMEQFETPASKLESQFNAINEVSAQYAVESNDIITAIRKTGSAFCVAGGSLEELVAIFSAIRSTTRESADQIATGLKTISGRLQRRETVDALKDLNVELRDAEGNFVGVFEAFQRIGKALSDISPQSTQFAAIVEQIGGLRQLSRVVPAITQYAKSQEILNTALSSGNSLQQNAQQAQQSLLIQVSRLKEEFLSLFREITGSTTFQLLAKSFLDTASAVGDLGRALAPVLPLIAAFGTAKIFTSIGQGSAARNFFGGFVDFFRNRDSTVDPLQAILQRRQQQEEIAAAKRIKSQREEFRAQQAADKEREQALKKEEAAVKRNNAERARAAALERQARLDAERSALSQAKVATERAKAARLSGGAAVGAAATPVIDKNTGAVNRLTSTIERLIAALNKNPPGSGGGGGGTRGPRAPRGGPSAGGTQASQQRAADKAQFAALIRDPGVAAVLSNIAAATAQKDFADRQRNAFFVSPTGVTGAFGDQERIRERDFANRRIEELRRRNLRRRGPDGRFLTGPANALVPVQGGPITPFSGIGPTGISPFRPAGGVRAFNPVSGQIVTIPPQPSIGGTRAFDPRDTQRAINETLGLRPDVLRSVVNEPGSRGLRGESPRVNASAKALEQASKSFNNFQRLSRIGRGIGTAAFFLAPTAADSLRDPESIDVAGRSRNPSLARSASVREASITGVTTGVLSGVGAGSAVGGPLGAAVGGIVGLTAGIISFADTLEKTQRDISDVRLGRTIEDVNSALVKFRQGLVPSDDVKKQLNNLGDDLGNAVRFIPEASTTFGTSGLGGFLSGLGSFGLPLLSGFSNPTTLEGLRNVELADIGRTNAEADQARRDRLEIRGTNIRRANENGVASIRASLDAAADRLISGGGGKIASSDISQLILNNPKLLNALASTTNTGIIALSRNEEGDTELARQEAIKVLNELNKVLQKRIDIEVPLNRILQSNNSVLLDFQNTIRKINDNLDSLSLNVENAGARFDAAADLAVGGTGRGFAINRPDLSGRTPQSVASISGLLGNAAGVRAGQLANIREQANILERIITDIPLNLIKENTTLQGAFGLGANRGNQFAALNINETDTQRILSAISGGEALVGESLRDFLKEQRKRPGGIAGTIAGVTDEETNLLKRAAELATKQLETFASKLERLNAIAEQTRQLQSAANQRGLQAVGARADLQSALTGRNRESFITSDQFLRPFVERIQPLLVNAGLGPLNATTVSPQQLKDRLDVDTALLKDLRSQPLTQENIAAQSKLVQSIRATHQAMTELGNATEPLADVERKLTAVVAERQAREQAARSFAGSGVRERFESEINRRFLNAAVQRGSFVNVNEQQRALQSAGQLGDAFRLPSGETVGEAINRLLRNTPQGVLRNVNVGVGGDEKQLRQKQIEILDRQTEFLNTLATVNKQVGETLSGELTVFSTSADKLTNALNSFSSELVISGNPVVDIRIVGGDVFSQLEPRFKELANGIVDDAITKLIIERFPGSGPPRR